MYMTGLQHNMHNIYGFPEAIVTSFAMAEIRGISRSTFTGIAHYSTWYNMKFTFPQLLSFSLFEVPSVSADTCGFNGNTTEEMCNF